MQPAFASCNAIVAAVPVRLMKRDLLFVVERLAAFLDERRLAIVLRQTGISKAKSRSRQSLSKLLAAFIRKSEESVLGRLLSGDRHSPFGNIP